MKFNKLRLGTMLLAATILFGSLAGIAFAGSDSTQNSSAEDFFNNFTAKLAANLGLDQDKVSAAIEATKKQMLEEAVQDGKLTQEQADKIASDPTSMGFGFPGKGHKMGAKGFNQDNIAKVLGITVDELKTQLQSGKNIQDLISEAGLTAEQFHEKMLELEKEAIAKDVESGKITQDQADKILERLEQLPVDGSKFFKERKANMD